MKSAKTKTHKLRRRILIALILLVVLMVVALSVVAYGPVRTLASLEKVDDFPLYVMTYHGTYLFDLFAETQGRASQTEAMNLLRGTSLDHTVWSVVYNLSMGQIQLAMGKDYNKLYTFKLNMKHRDK